MNIRLVWFILFIWFIWLIIFNQTNETNQINQITVFLFVGIDNRRWALGERARLLRGAVRG
jgi:O-antigen ligase